MRAPCIAIVTAVPQEENLPAERNASLQLLSFRNGNLNFLVVRPRGRASSRHTVTANVVNSFFRQFKLQKLKPEPRSKLRTSISTIFNGKFVPVTDLPVNHVSGAVGVIF